MKTKKKKKLRLNVLLLLIFLVYVIYLICSYIINISVDDIIVSGNDYVSDNEVISLSGITNDSKFLFLSSSKIESKIELSQYVKNASVSKSLFGDITITIEENKALFIYDYTGELILEGNNYLANYENVLGVPTLINYVPSSILTDFIEALCQIDSSLIYKISEIEYSPNIKDGIILDEERFIFKMNDSNTVHVNIINLSKFANYDLILEVESQKGTLYLDSSNDGNVFDLYD